MKKSVVSVAAFIFLLSCKKHTTENQPEPKTNYFPMTVGNTWVYKNYKIYKTQVDSENKEYDAGIDTVTVQKDSVINNKTYKKLSHTNFFLQQSFNPYYELLRDSSGFLINEKGEVMCSVNHLKSDTIYSYDYYSDDSELIYGYRRYMNNQFIDVMVPSGNFKTIAVETVFTKGCPYPDAEIPKYSYAPNVGLVMYENKFMSTENINFRSKLISYRFK